MKVIAIDPGGVTGWAVFSIPMTSDSRPIWGDRFQAHFSSYGQLERPDHHADLLRLLKRHSPDRIICERYEKRNNDFSLLISCEYIGVCRAFAQETSTPLVLQGASEALHFCDEGNKLARLGIDIKPHVPNKDAIAARKHLLYWLIFGGIYSQIRKRLLDELRLVEP